MKNIPFSSNLKEVVSVARDEAIRLHTNFIGPRHLVLALAKKQPIVFTTILKDGNASLAEIIQNAESEMPKEENATKAGAVSLKFRLFKRPAGRPASLYLNRPAEKVIRESVAVATKAGSTTVEPEHLFQSILINTDVVHVP